MKTTTEPIAALGSLTPSIAITAAVVAGIIAALLPLNLLFVGIGIGVVILSVAAGPYASLALVLTIAPIRALIDARAPTLLPIDILLVSMGLLVMGWGVSALLKRTHLMPLRFSPIVLGVMVFMASAALSLSHVQMPAAWLNEWLKWLFLLMLLLIVQHLAHWEWVALALACAGIANAVLGIYVYFGGSGVDHFAIDKTHFRAFGTFEQPNPFGGFMGILTPFLGALAIGALIKAWRMWQTTARPPVALLWYVMFFGVAAGLTAAGLIFSWSRGAWLALAAAVVVTALSLPRRWIHSLILFGCGGVLLLGVAASGRIPASITDRLTSSFADLFSATDVRGINITPENYAAIERFAHWQAAIEMARLYPWTGVGFGNYEAAYPQSRLLAWEFALGHAHNYYLNVLAEIGIIGLAAYLVMWCIIIMVTWQARRHPDPFASAAAAGLLGSWTYIAVHSLTDYLFVNTIFLHIGALIGIAALLHRQTWKNLRLRL
jgi:O-antigen ligase